MNKTVKNISLIIAIPLLFALILHFLVGMNWHSVFTLMFFIFLCLLPAIIGFITVYFSKSEKAKTTKYQIIAPLVSSAVAMFVIWLFAFEIWKLWFVILLPIILLSALGGLLGGYFNKKK